MIQGLTIGKVIKDVKELIIAGDAEGRLSADEQRTIRIMAKELQRCREALMFYAQPANYIDGECGRFESAAEGGEFVPDCGHCAQVALRLVDISGQPLTPIEVEAIQAAHIINTPKVEEAA